MASLDITIDAVKGLSDADKTRLVVAYLHGNDRGNVSPHHPYISVDLKRESGRLADCGVVHGF